MLDAGAARLARYVARGFAPDDDEPERIRKAATTLIVTLVIALSPLWIATYLALDRPVSAAIPAAYAVVSMATLGYLFRTKDGHFFLIGQTAMLLALPVILMWSLGGFVQGSAVILWSLTAPLLALMNWGRRAATAWFMAFVAVVIASGLLERYLTAAVAPLPEGVQTIFFVLNVGAPVATAMAALIYFVRQRDMASARSESLLLNILPAPIADRLKQRQTDVADRYESASVLFVDIVGFTAFAEQTRPERVVELLGRVFGVLDGLAERHGVEKIKTLGDGYLAVAGVPMPRPDHASAAASMALEVGGALADALRSEWPDLQVRVGIASGPLVAGVIGRRRFSYDIWGDTVNTASRMAALAAPGQLVVTAQTAGMLGDRFTVEPLPQASVKGKGNLRPFRLVSAAASA